MEPYLLACFRMLLKLFVIFTVPLKARGGRVNPLQNAFCIFSPKNRWIMLWMSSSVLACHSITKQFLCLHVTLLWSFNTFKVLFYLTSIKNSYVFSNLGSCPVCLHILPKAFVFFAIPSGTFAEYLLKLFSSIISVQKKLLHVVTIISCADFLNSVSIFCFCDLSLVQQDASVPPVYFGSLYFFLYFRIANWNFVLNIVC